MDCGAVESAVLWGRIPLYIGKKKAFGVGFIIVVVIIGIETVLRPMSRLGDPIGTHSVSNDGYGHRPCL